MIGWFSNWQYANSTPEKDWRGAMALPREITLYKSVNGIRVKQAPVRELETVQRSLSSFGAKGKTPDSGDWRGADKQLRAASQDGSGLRIDLALTPNDTRNFGLRVFQSGRHRTEIGVDVDRSLLYIDRTQSGSTAFSKDFPGRQVAPIRIDGQIALTVLLDRSSIEVFVNDGEVTMAERVYPDREDSGLSLFSQGESLRVRSLKISRIVSVWTGK
jgi:sucrose-6-phosphate hydrolase SacC (GH32 family)